MARAARSGSRSAVRVRGLAGAGTCNLPSPEAAGGFPHQPESAARKLVELHDPLAPWSSRARWGWGWRGQQGGGQCAREQQVWVPGLGARQAARCGRPVAARALEPPRQGSPTPTPPRLDPPRERPGCAPAGCRTQGEGVAGHWFSARRRFPPGRGVGPARPEAPPALPGAATHLVARRSHMARGPEVRAGTAAAAAWGDASRGAWGGGRAEAPQSPRPWAETARGPLRAATRLPGRDEQGCGEARGPPQHPPSCGAAAARLQVSTSSRGLEGCHVDVAAAGVGGGGEVRADVPVFAGGVSVSPRDVPERCPGRPLPRRERGGARGAPPTWVPAWLGLAWGTRARGSRVPTMTAAGKAGT